MMSTGREFVQHALSIGAISLLPEGRKLKSGRLSPYFFNSANYCTGESFEKLVLAYSSTIMATVTKVAAEWSKGEKPEVIFGPAYKGIPLAVGITLNLSHTYPPLRNLGYAFNRKERKDHGEGGVIVGAPLQGKRVIVVDDVMTSGESSGQAVEQIRAEDGTPISCTVAFDRQERGIDGGPSAVQEFSERYGVPVSAVATLDDLIITLELQLRADPPSDRAALIAETLPKILAYRQEYGVSNP